MSARVPVDSAFLSLHNRVISAVRAEVGNFDNLAQWQALRRAADSELLRAVIADRRRRVGHMEAVDGQPWRQPR